MMRGKVKLSFYNWKGDDEPVVLELSGEEGGISTATVLHGTLDMTPAEVYYFVRAARTYGRTPLFELEIVE